MVFLAFHSGSPVSHKKELSEWKIESGLLSYYENSTL
jgi:hypothetical protein